MMAPAEETAKTATNAIASQVFFRLFVTGATGCGGGGGTGWFSALITSTPFGSYCMFDFRIYVFSSSNVQSKAIPV
jgi:hypothetical protein